MSISSRNAVARRHAARAFLVLLLAFGVVRAPNAFAASDRDRVQDRQPSRLEVRGVVRDLDGSPVSGAVVVSEFGGQGISDADGSFAFDVRVPEEADAVGVTAVATVGREHRGGSVRMPRGDGGVAEGRIVMAASNGGASCGNLAWLPTFGSDPGLDGTVLSAVVFDDGTGPALHVGGSFTAAGTLQSNRIARWNGSEWSALGEGMNDSVFALAVFDDGLGGGPALYAGGALTTAGGVDAAGIARWDGASWTPVAEGIDGIVYALGVHQDAAGTRLHAGGEFTVAGTTPANRIAAWDGSSWSPLGNGMDDTVRALGSHDDGSGPALFVGGDFGVAGEVAASRIARWDGISWAALGGGLDNDVFAIAVFDDGSGPGLYCAGSFTTAGGVPARRVARWDGSAWSALGAGMSSGAVSTLAVLDPGDGSGPALHAGGFFTNAGGQSANYVARWDGRAWSPLDVGTSGWVRTLVVFDDGAGVGSSLFAGGFFLEAGGAVVNRIARWDGGAWSPLGSGFSARVHWLVVHDDGGGGGPALYAGGDFTSAGPVAVNTIARWTGDAWEPLGDGMNGTVLSMAVHYDGGGGGPALYAGGIFTTAGGRTVNHVARWDCRSWTPLGDGMNDWVVTLAEFDDGSGAGPQLYAGGFFTTAGGVPASRIARWDGTSWSPLGPGFNGTVFSLCVFDDGGGPALHAGGDFTTSGIAQVNRIARWDGATWSDLAGGMSNGITPGVYGMHVFDYDGDGVPSLFAGGGFLNAGGVPASRIARWDGVAWTSVGGGMNDLVWSMATFDDGSGMGPQLYAAGRFLFADGTPAARIAWWDGVSWSSLDSGMDDRIWYLTVFDPGDEAGPSLFAGGDFTASAGGDSFLARWGCAGGSPPVPGDVDGDGLVGFTDLLAVLNAWGGCPDCEACPADVDGDCMVGFGDVLVVLQGWS